MIRSRRLAFGLATCLALSACGSEAAPSAAAVSSAGAAKPASSAGAPASAKPAGSTPASGQPIKIGFLHGFTGPSAQQAKDNYDTFNLYLDTIGNSAAGRKIQVIQADSKAAADTALTKAKELVENDKVDLLAGMNLSTECFAVAPYVRDAKIPLVITDNCAAVRLMTDPRFASPWMVRTSTNGSGAQVLADYVLKQGITKADVVSIDNSGIQESADSFSKTFVERGGTIVQEQHPAFGTNDFGPIIAQLDQSADAVVVLEPGIDGLRFGEAWGGYGNKKLKVIDVIGGPTNSTNLTQLKDKTLGFMGQSQYPPELNNAAAQAWQKAWTPKYPDRTLLGPNTANGWAGAMVVVAALKAVNGNVEDRQAFMDALYKTDLDTNKGHLTLDKNHDVVQSAWVFDVIQGSGGNAQLHQLLQQDNVASDTFNSPQDLAKFPFGQLKGKWVGMTKDKLAELTK